MNIEVEIKNTYRDHLNNFCKECDIRRISDNADRG